MGGGMPNAEGVIVRSIHRDLVGDETGPVRALIRGYA